MTVQFNPKTKRRGIEWCDETRNATGGCMHDCKWEMPDGTTAVCYAKELAENGVAKLAYPHGFEYHYWRPEQLKSLVKGDDHLLIFCDSMSDMFASNVPEDQVRQILQAMRKAPHHSYQSLTKAAPQLLKYLDDLPPNLWVGVSSPPDWFMGKRLQHKQQESMLRRSLEVLQKVREKTDNITWMSIEPLSWDVSAILGDVDALDWAVIGAASSARQYFQPDPENVKRALRAMDAFGVAVFYKGNIKPMFEVHDLGSSELNRWREDFPGSYRDGTEIAAVARRQELCQRYGWVTSRAHITKDAWGSRAKSSQYIAPMADTTAEGA